MKKLLLLTGILFCVSGFFSQQAKCPILPSPVVYQKGEGTLYIPKQLSIQNKQITASAKKQLSFLLDVYHSLELKDTVDHPFIRLQKLQNVPKDFYSIALNDQIFISYANEQALYYAFHSLMQLIQSEDGIKYISKGFVQDYPKFEWRGLHLDVSRHFFTVNQIKRYLDLMSMYKFNRFHWHLTDDQGWRIEIKAFPKLTSIGAWRDSTIQNHYNSTPRTFEKKRYGGFYTQEQIKDIVAYASERHITIVPEIEMPGHSRAALAAYPEYSCTGIQQGVPGLWGVFEDIYCSKEESFVFIEKILDEVVSLFPGDYIHIGGDEAPKSRWKSCEQCQHVIKTNGLKDEHELQSYFIKRIEKYLTSKEKKLIGWDEILEGGLSPNATVMSWRGFKGGIEACKQAHYVVMTPGSHCYFDHYQGKSKEEPLAIGGYTPLEKVYDFNPVPKELDVAQASFVLGGQANLWTEYISSFKHLEYMAYPRAIALSQALWCTEKPDYNAFCEILYGSHFDRLSALGVNYSKTSQKPLVKFQGQNDGMSIELQTKDPNEKFHTIVHSSDCRTDLVFKLLPNQPLIVERTKHKLIKNEFSFTSLKSGLKTEVRINNHLGLGVPVNYKTPPNSQYNYSPTILVDGQQGSKPWRGHEWVGFDTSQIQLEIDLLRNRKIHFIELSFLNSNGSWIYLPKSVEIQKISKRSRKIYQSKNITSEKVQIRIGRRMKKIRIDIRNHDAIPLGMPGSGHTPWTFIDEIIIK